jgi:hypothetical protein
MLSGSNGLIGIDQRLKFVDTVAAHEPKCERIEIHVHLIDSVPGRIGLATSQVPFPSSGILIDGPRFKQFSLR